MSDQFIVVSTQRALDKFLESVNYLHDALIREVAVGSRGYVDVAGWMHGDLAPADAHLIFHSQNPGSPCIEMVFEELQKIRLQFGEELDPRGAVTEHGVTLYLTGGPEREQFLVSARIMRYRILGRAFVGREYRAITRIVDTDY